jgi:hypothetical protein
LPIKERRFCAAVPLCMEGLDDNHRKFLEQCKMGMHDDFLLQYNDEF